MLFYQNLRLLSPLLISSAVTALRYAPSSQCSAVCGVQSTTGDQIVCTDAELDSSTVGKAFEECIACEMNSTAADPGTGETDLQWLLYNVRYTMSYCLWGYPNNTNVGDNPCLTNPACGTFQGNIQHDSLSPNVSAYDYCPGFNTEIEPKCTACLQQLSTEYYMSNLFTILIAGCEQEPVSGVTLTLEGTPFSSFQLNITTATPTGSSSSKHTHLSLGAKVGIAAGSICFFLFLAGLTIVLCGKRRRRRVLAEENRFRQSAFTGPLGGFTNWPLQQQHGPEHHLTEESPAVSDHSQWQQGWEHGSEKTFSPYTSQYNSPVSATDASGNHRGWHGHGIEAVAGGKEKDIEMHRMRSEMAEDTAARDFKVAHAPIIRSPVPIARETAKEKEPFPDGF